MGGGFTGMDTEQVRELAARFSAAGRVLEGVGTRTGAMIGQVTWVGADAEAFRGDWSSHVAPLVFGGSVRVEGSGRVLEAEADEQDAASAGTSAGYVVMPSPGQSPLPTLSFTLGPPVDPFSRTDGLGQLGRDARSEAELWGRWLRGEEDPTLMELGAARVLTLGSSAVAGYELVTGEDSPLLDDRTAITIGPARQMPPTPAPQGLADLVIEEDRIRRDVPGLDAPGTVDDAASSRVRIQEVSHMNGSPPSFIVHVPPTAGGGLQEVDTWGAQGNPLGWDSNLRLAAGQDPASRQAVLAVMDREIPAGSEVMIVGHSQGGIIGASIAGDPAVNNTTGTAGTFRVTDAFSVGSPVQQVVPARDGTRVLNVAHDGDVVPALDVDGIRLGPDGGDGVTDVRLPTPAGGDEGALTRAHQSVFHEADGSVDPGRGYYGSLVATQDTDPELVRFRDGLEGRYLGDGTAVTRDVVVDVSRRDLR